MVASLRRVLLIVCLIAPILAIPTSQLTSSPTCSFHEQTTTYRSSPNESLWKRLRNSIIERLWSIPERVEDPNRYIRPDQATPGNFRRKYGNDVVLRFTIQTEDEARAFAEAASTLYLDVWDTSDNWVDVRIAKEMLPSFLGLLPPSLQSSHTPLMHDLAQAVYESYPSSPANSDSWRSHTSVAPPPTDNLFLDYRPLSIIYPWLRLQSQLFHPEISSITSIGTTPEGRDIPALHIKVRSDAISTRKPRQTILITAGSHAREWISISTVNYIAHTLLTRYNSPRHSQVTKLLKNYDVVIIPVLNPDGYEYTWTTDRLWRKTRQSTSIPFCPGFDLDRSFPFKWDGNSSLDNPCTESYGGASPLEAVESQILVNWTKDFTESGEHEIVAYLDLHSYSQQILYPFSYSCGAHPPTIEDLQEVAHSLAKDFRLTNQQFYGVTSACKAAITMGGRFRAGAGGSMLDWFYHDMKVRHAYSVKLRDTGTYGFLLPKENIIPSGQEAVEAVMGLGRWLHENYNVRSQDDVQDAEMEDIPEQTDDELRKEFISSTHDLDMMDAIYDDDDDREWERVYDPDFELKRRR